MNIPLKLQHAPVRVIAHRRQRGVTLIEILITLLVLAVGLLGLAALQAFSLSAGQSSYYRTQATNVAYQVADAARANRSQVIGFGTLPELTRLEAQAQRTLPGGQMQFQSNNDAISVTVSWIDDRGGLAVDAASTAGSQESVSFTFTSRL